MIRSLLPFLLTCFLAVGLAAQKSVHIPNYLQNPATVDGSQFTWSKTAQSANFIVIWGNTVGTDPANFPDPNLRFDPERILDTLEYIYGVFKQIGFADESAGTKLSQYKIPVVMYGTWGPNGAQGFANGGDADGIIGAFWVHPTAMNDGGVAAHELAHSLQAQAVIDYRSMNGFGPVWQNAGIFWESHANFMRNLLYPQFSTAWGMDVYHVETWGDWKNTYENYELLFAIAESEGIDMVNRLWRESLSGEYPLQAYKRLAGYDQATFNDSLYGYARRMATFDFTSNDIGQYLRQYRQQDLSNWLPSIQNTWSILGRIAGTANRYEIPVEQAPEEYAYNVIPLHVHPDSCAVIVKFKGHTGANAHAGWRYGFVAAKPDGTISRYSPTYSAATAEINFTLESGETRLYLVVMGAPPDAITTNTSNDTWHGYPRHFRFPYELHITGALPEGFQPASGFRSPLRGGGHAHANGGGWVQNQATVGASVYVGPMAMVLGSSNLSGQVRVEGTAVVRNATMTDQVEVLDNAFVSGGTYSGQAVIRGQAFAENLTMSGNALVGMRARVSNYTLSGTVEVGGDVVVYNENGNCDNGVHYRLTNYYDNKLLECDGRTANHPANLDVNSGYPAFSEEQMALQCRCAFTGTPITVDSVSVSAPTCAGNNGAVTFHISTGCGPFHYAWSNGAASGAALNDLSPGAYDFTVTDNLGRQIEVAVTVPVPPPLFATLSTTPYDCPGGTGGTASVTVSTGQAPFAYNWSNGATVPAVAGLEPGSYALTVTDAEGCTFLGNVDIGLAGSLGVGVDIVPASSSTSADGALAITAVTGGPGPFSIEWSTGDTASILSNLPAGDYHLTVTNAAGCSFAATYTVSFSVGVANASPDLLRAAIVPNPSTGAARLVVFTSPGQAIRWTLFDALGREVETQRRPAGPGERTLPLPAALPAGSYRVVVADENGTRRVLQWIVMR